MFSRSLTWKLHQEYLQAAITTTALLTSRFDSKMGNRDLGVIFCSTIWGPRLDPRKYELFGQTGKKIFEEIYEGGSS